MSCCSNLPAAQQVVLVGNGRGYLSAIITGTSPGSRHRRGGCSKSSHCRTTNKCEPFMFTPSHSPVENGLLTANGKLKRDLIAARLQKKRSKKCTE